jgi:tetratricopeptide (TPR) repeat protein
MTIDNAPLPTTPDAATVTKSGTASANHGGIANTGIINGDAKSTHHEHHHHYGPLMIAMGGHSFRLEPYPRRTAEHRPQPSHLLDPHHAVVPYRSRAADERRLTTWRDDPWPGPSVLYLYGPGGQGKTRLAGHLASTSVRDGWRVLRAEHRPASPGAELRSLSVTDSRPLLIVVDYADRWPDADLVELARHARHAVRTRRLRMLLLGRSEEAWDAIAAELDGLGVHLAGAVALGPFTPEGQDRVAAFSEAAAALSAASGCRVAAVAPPPGDIDDNAFESPLLLHMAAFAAVYAQRDSESIPLRSDLSGFLLRHERRYWTAIAAAEGRPLTHAFESVVFIATLFGPLRGRVQGQWALRRTELADGPAEARALVGLHARFYPGGETATAGFSVLAPLVPDRLAEDFVGEYVRRHPDALSTVSDLVELHEDESDVDDDAVRRCLSMLAAGGPHHKPVARLLFDLLREAPGLIQYASRPALDFVTAHAPIEVLELIDRELPDSAVDVARPALLIDQRLYEALPASETGFPRAARLLNLSHRLSQIGDRAGALERTEQAVAIARASADVDSHQFLQPLAATLKHLAVDLGAVGRHREAVEAAREAMTLYRMVAENDSETYGRELANALANLAAAQSTMGQKRAAANSVRESVAILRRIVNDDPDPDLARCLMNLGLALSETGHPAHAVETIGEAVRMIRTLSRDDPRGYEDLLATALLNYSAHLDSIGRNADAAEAAQEVTDIRRRFAEVEPFAHEAGLATALANLSTRRALIGDEDRAIEAGAEAIDIYRGLAEREPVLFDHNAVMALNNLGGLLLKRGERGRALELLREAVDRSGRLAHAERSAHLALHAFTTANLAAALRRLDDAQATAVTADAAEMYRELCDAEPGVYDRKLAALLAELGTMHVDARRLSDALAPTQEAVEVWRAIASADNTIESFLSFGAALHRAAWVRWRCGVELDIALSDAAKALKIYEACDDGASDTTADHGLAVLELTADLFDALGEPGHAAALRQRLSEN